MTDIYSVIRAPAAGFSRWDDPQWAEVEPVPVALFHAQSSDHRPVVEARLAYSPDRLWLRFLVHDRYVVSRELRTNGPVHLDSCVEFFVAPLSGRDYFNVEVNAGGTLHCSHMWDPTVVDGRFVGCADLEPEETAQFRIQTTLPRRIEHEITDAVTWGMQAEIPLAVFAGRLKQAITPSGTWRANFYKCGDQCSHPHWASWAPIGERLFFHQPERFGTLRFV